MPSTLSIFALSMLAPALAEDEPAPAEEPASEGEVLVVEEPRAVVRALPGATVTSIDVSAETARVLDLGDLLASAPGVRVRSTGGNGGMQLVQLRGGTGGQVRVLVDGVPLPQDAAGAVDLGSLPLDSVERIEVYRGSLPLGLGGEGVAGAINLVTRQPRGIGELRLTGAAGSFHSYEGSAGIDAGLGGWNGGLWLAGASARNDFPFLDDNGTPYTSADDDPAAVRHNADVRRGELGLRARREGAAGRSLSLSSGAVLKDAGVPGPASYQVSEARLSERRAQADVRYRAGERLRTEVGLSGILAWQRYQDPAGEVGLGMQDQTSANLAAAADGLLELSLVPALSLALAARAEDQSFQADNALDADDPAFRRRDRLSTTLEASGDWRTLGYGLRGALDWARSDAEGGLPLAMGGVGEAEDVLMISPTGSLSWQPAQRVGLRASGGLAHRLPTFPELYGDAGTVVGNEDLRPERGVSGELGTDLALERTSLLGLLSLTAYHREVRDLIAYVQSSQYTLRAENFERVRVQGLEAEGGLDLALGRVGDLEAGLAYSLTRSRCLASYAGVWGSALPGLPVHQGFLDLAVERGRVEVGGSLEAQGASWRDTANLQRIPPRALVHARLSVSPSPRGPVITAEVRNLLDHRTETGDLTDLETGGPAVQAVADFLGYPLPGRAIYLGVDWSWGP